MTRTTVSGADRLRIAERQCPRPDQWVPYWIEALLTVPAAAVLEQMSDGDGPDARIDLGTRRRLQVVEQLEGRLIERQMPLLHQLENHRRRDRLGDARDPEQAVGFRPAGLPR